MNIQTSEEHIKQYYGLFIRLFDKSNNHPCKGHYMRTKSSQTQQVKHL